MRVSFGWALFVLAILPSVWAECTSGNSSLTFFLQVTSGSVSSAYVYSSSLFTPIVFDTTVSEQTLIGCATSGVFTHYITPSPTASFIFVVAEEDGTLIETNSIVGRSTSLSSTFHYNRIISAPTAAPTAVFNFSATCTDNKRSVEVINNHDPDVAANLTWFLRKVGTSTASLRGSGFKDGAACLECGKYSFDMVNTNLNGLGCGSMKVELESTVLYDSTVAGSEFTTGFAKSVLLQIPCECPSSLRKFTVLLSQDQNPSDNGWSLRNIDTGEYLAQVASADGGYLCLGVGNYIFELYDKSQNGICCDHGFGAYALFVGDELLIAGTEFLSLVSYTFSLTD